MRPRRQRPTDEPTGHDRWLISYADFITLLFAFFVVLFASSYRDNQVVKKLSQAIHIGFQQMGAFSGGQSNTGVAYPNLHPDPDHPPSPIPPDAAQSVDILKLQKQLEAAMGQELKNHEVAMRATPEGFVISLNELGFFDSGHADLLPGASDKIKRIANVLSINGLDLRVEGHSDDQPIHTAQFQSNWELSTARAMAVMQMLVNDAGFDPKNISIAGYGQYRPVADNSTSEGRRLNRRVDLVVVETKNQPPHNP